MDSNAVQSATRVKKIQVDKDKVRMMVADFGYAKTSESLNIKEATLRQWAKRFKWNVTMSHSQAVTTVTKPIADAHSEALEHCKRESKVNLAKYALEASSEAAEHKDKLSISRKVKDVADIRASIFPPDTNSSNILQIGFLIGPRSNPDNVNSEPTEKLTLGETVD